MNLGSNRWTFKPRVGVSQPFEKWIVEGHLTAWFFTDNPNSFGNTLSQDPMWALDGHLTRLFGKGVWAAVDLGYIIGGRLSTNGVAASEQQKSARVGATLAIPLAKRHSVKLGYFAGFYTRLGSDFDNLYVLYQYRWGGGI